MTIKKWDQCEQKLEQGDTYAKNLLSAISEQIEFESFAVGRKVKN